MGFLTGSKHRQRRYNERKIENAKFINDIRTNNVKKLNPIYNIEKPYYNEEIERRNFNKLNFIQRNIHYFNIWLNKKFN